MKSTHHHTVLVILLFFLAITSSVSAQETNHDADSTSSYLPKKTYQLKTIVITSSAIDEEKQEIESRKLRVHNLVDFAEILSDELVEVSMIRKGGYGNEVSMRGFGQANMKVLADGGILEGACGSRKDPALSHISLLTVDKLILRQGPFDVSKSGYLGGYVDVISKKPTTEFSGEALAKAGSFGFLSSGFTTSGGNDIVQGIFGYNYSESDQYKDGNGNELWKVREGDGIGAKYNQEGRAMKSFKKNDIWGKVQFTPNKNHRILLEHTYGQAEDIMTPRAGMDIEEETSNLTKASLEIRDLGSLSEQLALSVYRNQVEHLPYNKYRIANPPKNNIAESVIYGLAIENETITNFATLQYGIDLYQRDWEVDVFNRSTGATINANLIPSVQSTNLGSYIQLDKDLGKWLISSGLRYDRFKQEAEEDLIRSGGEQSQTDHLLSGYISARYFMNENTDIWGGVGRNYRTPTCAERYLQANPKFFGNPDLDPTANTEFDLGLTYRSGPWWLQTKAFYSDLKDYIYQQQTLDGNKSFTNIDATLWGGDIKVGIDLLQSLSLEGGAAYQRGRKQSFPDNNNDKDLGQIAPLKGRLALSYNNNEPWGQKDTGLFGTLEWIHSEAADNIDADAGEQDLAGWDIMNLRMGYRFKVFTLNIGIDNVFDKKYTVANSYEWDVISGSGATPAIVNEPGRIIYSSIGYAW